MKKLSILGLFIFALISFNSCETEDDVVFTTSGSEAAVVTLPDNGASIVLDINEPMSTAATIVWDGANYSVPTAVSYTVQLALSNTDFAAPIDAGSTTENFLVWTNEQLNSVAVNNLMLTPFTAANIDLRVQSTIGDGAEPRNSNVVTLSVTPYTTDLPRLAVPGNHQGWNPSEAEVDFVPYIAASAFGETDFEGYVFLDGGFKFVEANDVGVFEWGNKDWGDDGTFSGSLISDGETDLSASAGYYYVRANTDPNNDGTEPGTYTIEATSWAITGSATPLGWPDNGIQDQDMTYNATTRKWEITINLDVSGEYKFRANDAWGLNFGTDDNDDGSLDYGGGNFTVPESGMYLVELDLSNPRGYSQTITLQ
ncbi:SusE domain-containing protein [uncultured Winogradskyella sp.]|uniref:SusE domain-containing protein n=1 Tax=uncultured Winogradskyella sp. TaxID=395353 RepID=UPI002609B8DB|nr:SusE domain-containing protein [uncultured Winogradskyella sp.]